MTLFDNIQPLGFVEISLKHQTSKILNIKIYIFNQVKSRNLKTTKELFSTYFNRIPKQITIIYSAEFE